MLSRIRDAVVRALRWSEKYTKTDMVYLFNSNFWIQSSSLFVSFASFLLYIVFGHVLPKDVYGTYQYLLSVGAIVSAFTLTGMTTSVMRAVARGYEGSYRESIRVQLLWGIVPLVGAWLFGTYYLLHGNTTLGWGLGLIGIFTPLSATFNTYAGYLAGKKDFKRGFTYSLFVNIPYYIAVALVAFSLPFALALLAANLISQTIGYFVAHRKTLATYKPNNEHDEETIAYGKHLSVMNFLSLVISQIDNVLVFHFLGAADLALYSFATAIPSRLGIFKALASAAFPKYAGKTLLDVRSSLGRKLLLSIGGALCIALVYQLLAYPFFNLFFPRYLQAVPFSRAYAFIIVVTFSSIFTTILTAHGRVKRLYAYNIISPLILLVSELVGILHWGLWGLVYAVIFANLLSSLLSAVLVIYGEVETKPHMLD